MNISEIMANRLESTQSKTFSNNNVQTDAILPEKEIDPCTALWRAVIMQALIDAGNNFKRPEYRNYKAQAISWLSGLSDDFHEVCTLADLDPDYVKKMAKQAISRNCKWRKEPSEKKPLKFKKDNMQNAFDCLNRLS